jgi:hypothetical protein
LGAGGPPFESEYPDKLISTKLETCKSYDLQVFNLSAPSTLLPAILYIFICK